jgi:O-antigen ligase
MLSQKFILRLMLAMLVVALVLTRSRMGNTGFFASLLITGFIALFAFRSQCSSFANMFSRRETKSAVVLIISLLLIDMFIVGAWFGVEKLTDRISQTSAEADAGRLDVAKRSIGLLRDYPLVGGGGGGFHTVYARYRSGEVKQYYDHAHQDYLEIIADVGGVGFSLLALVVLLSLYTALRTLFRTRDLLLRGMSFASVMGIIALLIHSTVDFNLQIPANAATFMIILALGWIASSLDRDLKISGC